MMSQFAKTGLESRGLKFYLIKNVDNATTESLNSLLKFLEEPGNELTYAILTTNQIDKVLPTIISRCLKVTFHPYPLNELLNEEGKAAEASEYYLAANIGKGPEKRELLLADDIFRRSLIVFRRYLPLFKDDFYYSLVLLESEGLIDRKTDKDFLTYWLACNIQFFKDLNYNEELPIGWYGDFIKNYRPLQEKSTKILSVFLSAFDQLSGSLNLNLLMEKMFWQLKEIML